MSPEFRARAQASIAVDASGLAGGADAQDGVAYRNANLSAPDRAADRVAGMTREEKVGHRRHAAPAIPRRSALAYNGRSRGLRGVAYMRFSYGKPAPKAAAGVRSIEPGVAERWIGGGQPVSRPGMPQSPGVAPQLQINGRQGLAN